MTSNSPRRSLAVLLALLAMPLVVNGVAAPLAARDRSGAPGPQERARPERTIPVDAPEDIDLLWEALRIVEDRYVDQAVLTDENLTRGAIRGLVEALGDDGHTEYLTPEEVAAEREALDGRLTGIGVVVDRRAGLPVIVSVIDGSPADLAGLRAQDLIVSIDGRDIVRLGVDDVVELVRGVRGTSVRLGIERPGAAEPFEVEVVRDAISIEPVDWALVPGSSVALVRLVQFSVGAARDLRSAVEEALLAGAQGMILDLRGNPGGLVNEAVSIAGVFLDRGVVYRERGRDGESADVSVRGDVLALDLPLVILVDYGTASSAEILAAALRDNDRAVVVGEQTYGTGTVLNTIGLSDGSAIRLGVRRWLTPDGEGIFGVGIQPDQEVVRPLGAQPLGPDDMVTLSAPELAVSDDTQLRRALEILGR